jgi:hypothetical protein
MSAVMLQAGGVLSHFQTLGLIEFESLPAVVDPE